MPGRLRAIAMPFVVAPPMGTRIRTRLRLSVADQAVLREVGEYLGRLAGQDLGERCRLGHGDGQRTRRKRLLTGACSSRWAGAITRTSQDQWQRGYRNLVDERTGLRRAIRRLRARLAAPVGGRAGRARGYASRAERWEKQRRLDLLTARLVHVDGRIAQGRVSLVRGGRRLLRARCRTRPAHAAHRQPHLGRKTGSGNRERTRVQVAEDRSRPPVSPASC